MDNMIKVFGGVRGYVSENGTAMLNAEDVARGWGFTQNKNGVEYVRWETINNYLSEFGFSQQVGKNDFLPENMVYRLGFKASNETAQRFQVKLADEILPSIRKHGGYLTPAAIEQAMLNPDFIINLATKLKEEQAKVALMQPKADFYDTVANSESLLSMGDVAKTLDMGIGRNNLFKELRKRGILMDNNTPYQRYVDAGYFKLIESKYMAGDNPVVVTTTYVKQKGVDYIRKLLSSNNRKRVS